MVDRDVPGHEDEVRVDWNQRDAPQPIPDPTPADAARMADEYMAGREGAIERATIQREKEIEALEAAGWVWELEHGKGIWRKRTT